MLNLLSKMKENLLPRPQDYKSGGQSPPAQERSSHGQ
jgi:hypothetical protein